MERIITKVGLHASKSPFVKIDKGTILVPRGKYRTRLEAEENRKLWGHRLSKIVPQKNKWVLYTE